MLRASILLLFTMTLPAADLILHHGRVVTVNKDFAMAEAVAVKDGRIEAVGSNAEILRLKNAHTTVVDLGGKTVLPGLIDSHVHSTGASMYEFDHPIPDMNTIADVLAYVRSRAATVAPGEWITLSQVFITRLREQRYPTRAELDEAAPRNPVAFRTGPDASLNSLALKLSGISRGPFPGEGRLGKVERDPKTGEPTGIVRNALRLIAGRASGRTPTMDDRRRRLKMLLADYNSVGITSIVERTAGDDTVELFRSLKQSGELTCRTFITYSVDPQQPIEKIEGQIGKLAASPLHRYDNMLWVRGVKVFLDGGMLTGSAYMLKPWGVSPIYSITDPNYRGMLYIEPAKLFQIARAALSRDMQLTAHTVGDGAVRALSTAYEEVSNEFPVREKRPCISHANFMTMEDIERMRRVGIVADLQPAWLRMDGATLTKHFGEERLRYFQPYRTLFARGVVVGGGSDHMQKIGNLRSNNPYNPFLGMWTTLVRRPRWTEKPLVPEEGITREQAIRFYTINNAYLTFEEKEKGSIEAGKLADLVVIDRDILRCPVDEVKDVTVERTYLGGKLVYRRP
ncbi:MAG: amidohydrolase [Acidobacteriales bacterium]|nr:amidohydrolase [Terriglobales bacterium]